MGTWRKTFPLALPLCAIKATNERIKTREPVPSSVRVVSCDQIISKEQFKYSSFSVVTMRI